MSVRGRREAGKDGDTMSGTGEGVTRWWWVRHAPVPDGGRIYGQRDLDADCSDDIVFKALADELPRKAVWVTSNLKRTHQTAAAIRRAAPERHQPLAELALAELAEQHLGEWQGRNRQEFLASLDHDLKGLWFAPSHERAPGGESFNDLVERVHGTVRRLTAEHRSRHIVAVTHGGTIRAALGLALGLHSDAVHAFTIENCSLTEIEHSLDSQGRDRWRVVSINHRPWPRSGAAKDAMAATKA